MSECPCCLCPDVTPGLCPDCEVNYCMECGATIGDDADLCADCSVPCCDACGFELSEDAWGFMLACASCESHDIGGEA